MTGGVAILFKQHSISRRLSYHEHRPLQTPNTFGSMPQTPTVLPISPPLVLSQPNTQHNVQTVKPYRYPITTGSTSRYVSQPIYAELLGGVCTVHGGGGWSDAAWGVVGRLEDLDEGTRGGCVGCSATGSIFNVRCAGDTGLFVQLIPSFHPRIYSTPLTLIPATGDIICRK